MIKKIIFSVFCLLGFSYISTAQMVVAKDSVVAEKPVFITHNFSLEEFPATNIKVVPTSFYTDKLSFFCDKEWKLEKSTGVPFKFRLGSVEQTDYLEGKRNAYKPTAGL